MQYTCRDFFFPHCSKQFLNSFCCVLFHLFPISKTFPFEDFFLSGETNKQTRKVTWGEIRGIGRVEHGGHVLFLVKNCWTLIMEWAGEVVNYPSWNGQPLKEFSKNFTEAEHNLSQQHQLVYWCRWVLRTFTWWGEACTTRGPPSRR